MFSYVQLKSGGDVTCRKVTGHKIINGPIHEPPFDARDLTEQMSAVKTRFMDSAHKSRYFADICINGIILPH
jgi:hypothetical protein